jgi:hypothetical protein
MARVIVLRKMVKRIMKPKSELSAQRIMYCLNVLLILKIKQDIGSYLRSSISRISIFHHGTLGFLARRFGEDCESEGGEEASLRENAGFSKPNDSECVGCDDGSTDIPL